MNLSNELITQFAKMNSAKTSTKNDTLVYGTTVVYGDSTYVKMDGSDLLTPISTTTEINDGERVLVTIKDHSAIITGNLSNPSASTSMVEGLSGQVVVIGNLIADKADINDLHATNAVIQKLQVDKADINDLHATNAVIQKLEVDKANITDLTATNAVIQKLEATLGEIDTLVSGNISSENIQTGGITGTNLNMNTIIVKNANIESVSADKVVSGRLDTNLVNIQSNTGNLIIKDNTIQIKDDTKVRVQIGKDLSGDYSMSVWDVNGKLMFDARGLTSDAIKNDIIRNDMISSNANITGDKLDINSVISSVNQNGTTTIKSSKIKLDQTNQTLDVAFIGLTTKVEGAIETTNSNTTMIGVMNGKINTLIQDTSIVTNGESMKLKDAYSKIEQTVNGINTTVGQHSTSIQDISGTVGANKKTIEEVKTEQSTITQNINTITSKVTSLETTNGQLDTRLKQAEQKITDSAIVSTVTSSAKYTGDINGIKSRLSTAEQKITPTAIVSTVTASTTYKNDLTGKVSTNKIISSINQTAESIKIDAKKIELTGEVVANAINNGTTTIDGGKIATDSVAAKSIKIGDFNNYVMLEHNAFFNGVSGSTSGYEICSIAGSEKYNHEHITNKIYGINSGEKFRIKAYAQSALAGSIVEITCCWRNAVGDLVLSSTVSTTIVKANTWEEINTIITVPNRPSDGAYIRFKININTTQSRRVLLESFIISRMYTGELIVDGSITAEKLSANAIDGKLITGTTIVGGAIRGSSNFFTAPDPTATEGYGFRIYSTGAMYTNNHIQIEGNNEHVYLGKDGVVDCSSKVISPNITTGDSALWWGIKGAGRDFSKYNLVFREESDSYIYFRPGNNSTIYLGHKSAMFNTAYIKNGVSSSSDRTLKENIQYLADTHNPRTVKSNDISEVDLYNFVRDDLLTARFNFIGDDKLHIGFIAQDLLYNSDGSDNKVGQILIDQPDDERSPLSYNEKIYANILAGALRYAILKIENLEGIINGTNTNRC